MVLCPKLVLLLTDVLAELSLCYSFCHCFCFSFSMLERHSVLYTSVIPEVMWYKPLYNRKKRLRTTALDYHLLDQSNRFDLRGFKWFVWSLFTWQRLMVTTYRLYIIRMEFLYPVKNASLELKTSNQYFF